MPLTLAEVAEIRLAAHADDLPINEHMCTWSHADIQRFYESGGLEAATGGGATQSEVAAAVKEEEFKLPSDPPAKAGASVSAQAQSPTSLSSSVQKVPRHDILTTLASHGVDVNAMCALAVHDPAALTDRLKGPDMKAAGLRTLGARLNATAALRRRSRQLGLTGVVGGARKAEIGQGKPPDAQGGAGGPSKVLSNGSAGKVSPPSDFFTANSWKVRGGLSSSYYHAAVSSANAKLPMVTPRKLTPEEISAGSSCGGSARIGAQSNAGSQVPPTCVRSLFQSDSIGDAPRLVADHRRACVCALSSVSHLDYTFFSFIWLLLCAPSGYRVPCSSCPPPHETRRPAYSVCARGPGGRDAAEEEGARRESRRGGGASQVASRRRWRTAHSLPSTRQVLALSDAKGQKRKTTIADPARAVPCHDLAWRAVS